MLLRHLKNKAEATRSVEVGWLLNAEEGGFIWGEPTRLISDRPPPRHAKSASLCPAVIDHEARFFVVHCPINVKLRVKIIDTGEATLINTAGDKTEIRTKTLGKMVKIVAAKEWRYPDRPIIQIHTPYIFIADEPTFMSLLPPFNYFRTPSLPGRLISGRLPIHIWPRPMMWAFEWIDTTRELELERGEPWFYVHFETHHPARQVRLVEAELTPQLKEYMQGARAVTNYVNRTYSLFKIASQRRPQRLLSKKVR